MDLRRLEPISLYDPSASLDLNTSLKAPEKVKLDVVGGDVRNRTLREGPLKMQGCSLVRFMCLLCADWGLGIILQEEIRHSAKRSCSAFRTTSMMLSSLA